MSDAAYRDLKTALAASPENVVLRVTVLRLAREAGELSDALALAAPLSPEQVARDTDRAVIAEIYAEAGLADQAATWRDGAAPNTPPPRAPAPSSEPPAGDPFVPEPERPMPGAKPSLRVVGGSEGGGTDASAEAAYGETDAKPAINFADVGGLEEVKKDIHRRIILPFKQPGLLARFKKRAGGGVLLYGPPGCGKTLLARATAGECGAKFFSVSLAEVLDPYVGVSERNLKGVFDTARAAPPAVLFFDEIDALGGKRRPDGSQHAAQLANAFLAEMDGVDSRNEGVLVLAATNAPWTVDPAFLRPGRFDRLFFAPPPDRAARAIILELELRERFVAADVDPIEIAEKTSGYSGADLTHLVERASDAAIDRTLDTGVETPIDQKMLRAAVGETKNSVSEWLQTARNYATYANEGGRYDDILAFLEKHGKRR